MYNSMNITQLTKREYLGKWNYHKYFNQKTGEELFVECTDEEYTKMGQVGGSVFNPSNDGDLIWVGSCGGADKIDTGNYMFEENDYTIRDSKYLVCTKNNLGFLTVKEYNIEEFNQIYK